MVQAHTHTHTYIRTCFLIWHRPYPTKVYYYLTLILYGPIGLTFTIGSYLRYLPRFIVPFSKENIHSSYFLRHFMAEGYLHLQVIFSTFPPTISNFYTLIDFGLGVYLTKIVPLINNGKLLYHKVLGRTASPTQQFFLALTYFHA